MKSPSPKKSADKSKPSIKALSPEKQLDGFIAKFDSANARLIRECRAEMQKLLPTAIEMVYDNYNFFVIGYCPTERPSDALLSIAAAANGVGLCFIQGAKLPDPHGLLQGGGKQTRFLRLPTAATLRKPGVLALLKAALAQAKTPMPGTGGGQLVIRSISAKQRPRRKTAD